MHVLGLPPAFVLSQDQTLKLKVSILVGLEVTPRNLCVTGTFTQSASRPVARTGCTVVMAETQRSPESRRPPGHLRARRIRQDSAACVSLSSIHLSKSAVAATAIAARFTPARRGKNEAHRPGRPRRSFVSIRRLPAHCRASTHDARTHVIKLIFGSCQLPCPFFYG